MYERWRLYLQLYLQSAQLSDDIAVPDYYIIALFVWSVEFIVSPINYSLELLAYEWFDDFSWFRVSFLTIFTDF